MNDLCLSLDGPQPRRSVRGEVVSLHGVGVLNAVSSGILQHTYELLHFTRMDDKDKWISGPPLACSP